jgi:glycosyltransferase involved in cell wall biosynthesis
MSKPLLVFQAPIATRSGYGERSRDLVRALIATEKYDIKIVSTRWGDTPMNALSNEDQDIISRMLMGSLNQQPDIYMQVTVPNEFQRVGKLNIGVTAGIETTLCSPEWIEGINKMDLVLVSSKHAKDVFEAASYEKRDSRTNQPIGHLKCERPIEVLFEGLNLDVFNKDSETSSDTVKDIMSQVKEDFAFLFVGHWLPGQFGEDRKNVALTIKLFLESFKNKTNAPALILKTSGGKPSIVDRDQLQNKIDIIKKTVDTKVLPNIYVIHGDLTDAEMNDLYNHPKVKVHVSLTKGEGFGRPLIEAAITGKPVIASNWSGHLDFLDKDTSFLVPGQLTNVHPSAAWDKVILTEASWWSVEQGYVIGIMRDIFKNYKNYLEKSRKTTKHIKDNFSLSKMQETLDSLITPWVDKIPKKVELQLPKLKKAENENVKKIDLPKLKKIDLTQLKKVEDA